MRRSSEKDRISEKQELNVSGHNSCNACKGRPEKLGQGLEACYAVMVLLSALLTEAGTAEARAFFVDLRLRVAEACSLGVLELKFRFEG